MTAPAEDGITRRSNTPQIETPTLRLPELKPVEIDGIEYTCPTSDEMGIFTLALAKEIIESGQDFDRVVAIAKGGVSWSRYLVDYLGMRDDNRDPKTGSVLQFISVSGYSGTQEREDRVITQPLPHRVDGERILLFDEVADGGGTISEGRRHVFEYGAADVRIATLAYKPRSTIVPDYHAFETSTWIAFPHDRREFIEDKASEWLTNNPGMQIEEVRTRLLKIGVLAQEIGFFLPAHWAKIQTLRIPQEIPPSGIIIQ